jgi:hypothetical protein
VKLPFNTAEPTKSWRVRTSVAVVLVKYQAPASVTQRLNIAINKPRSMEREKDSDEEPKLVGTHVQQLQKYDAQTKAENMPMPIIKTSNPSICI